MCMCMPYCMPRYATFLICTSRAATRYELSTRYPHFRVASLSFFLLQTSSFTSQSLCSTHLQTRLLTNGYGRPLPRGPTRSITDRDEGDDAWRGQDTTTLTCPCLVVSLHLHTRRRRAPRGCPHGITMSLAFARAPSPHSFRRFTLFFVSFFFSFFCFLLLWPSRRALATILADGRAAVLPFRAYHGATADRDGDDPRLRHHAA